MIDAPCRLRHRIANDVLELFEIRLEALTPLGREPAQCLWPPVFESLPHFDEPGLLEHVEMPAEIAVRQCAEPLQIREQQAFGAHDERCHDPQPGFLVQHALEPVIGEATRLRELRRFLFLQEVWLLSAALPARDSNTRPLP